MSYKVHFGADIRRFFLEPNSFFALREKLITLFRLRDPQISWRDEEGDMITIAGEDDLRTSHVAANGQTVRLFVVEGPESDDVESLGDVVVVSPPSPVPHAMEGRGAASPPLRTPDEEPPRAASPPRVAPLRLSAGDDGDANPPPDTPATPITPAPRTLLSIAPMAPLPEQPHPDPDPQPSPLPAPSPAPVARAADAGTATPAERAAQPAVFLLPPPEALAEAAPVVAAEPEVRPESAEPAPAAADQAAALPEEREPLLAEHARPASPPAAAAAEEPERPAAAEPAEAERPKPGHCGPRACRGCEPPSPLESTFNAVAQVVRNVYGEVRNVYGEVERVLRPAIPRVPRGARAAPPTAPPRPATEAEAAPAAAGPDVVHPGITCDGCNSPVVGRRYKCCVCPDFDLCMRCEASGAHPEHPMVRLCQPAPPRGLWANRCPRWARRFAAAAGNAASAPAAAPAPVPAADAVPAAAAPAPTIPSPVAPVSASPAHSTPVFFPASSAPRDIPVSFGGPASTSDRDDAPRPGGSPVPPPSPAPGPLPWAHEVQQLREMGFDASEQTLRDLLRRCNGVVADVVARLLA